VDVTSPTLAVCGPWKGRECMTGRDNLGRRVVGVGLPSAGRPLTGTDERRLAAPGFEGGLYAAVRHDSIPSSPVKPGGDVDRVHRWFALSRGRHAVNVDVVS